MVASLGLFAMDRSTGAVRWTYASGVICNPAIAIGDGRVYFAESRNPKLRESGSARFLLTELLASDVYIVALDAANGEVVWEKPCSLTECEHILYASYARGVLLLLGSRNEGKYVRYHARAFDGGDGAGRWRSSHNHTTEIVGGEHGEQVHHPVIANGIVFAEPVAYNLQTGERVNPKGEAEPWSMKSRTGCGTMSGSAYCLFYRDSNPNMYDPDTGSHQKITDVSRPGCWINIIPAGGLVLIPEASSGCTCNYAIQSSMAFIPIPGGLD